MAQRRKSILGRFFGAIGRGFRAIIPNPTLTKLFNLSQWRRNILGFGNENPYAMHPWVYAAIEAISRNLQQLPLKIKQGTEEESRIVKAGEWNNRLANPNQVMTWRCFIKVSEIQLDVTGATFWMLLGPGGARIKKGQIPTEMWPISGDSFVPWFQEGIEGSAGATGAMRKFLGWKAFLGGKEWEIAPHEVVLIREPDPDDPYAWLAPIRTLRRAVDIDLKADDYDLAYLENSAQIGGIVTVPEGTAQEDQEVIERDWGDKHKGPRKAFRIAVMEGVSSYTSTTATHKDMEMIARRGWNRETVFAIFGVPKREVGLDEGSNMITGAGGFSSDLGFWQRKLLPRAALYAEAITQQLLKPNDPTLFAEFDVEQVHVLQGNVTEKLLQAESAQRLGYTLNQINERFKLGMPNVEWGNTPLMGTDLMLFGDEPAGLLDESGSEHEEEEVDDVIGELPSGEVYSRGSCGDCGGRIIEGAFWRIDDGRDDELGEEDAEVRRIREDAEYWNRAAKKSLFPMESTFNKSWRKHLMKLRAHQLNAIKKNPPKSAKELDALLFDRKGWDAKARKATLANYEKTIATAERDMSEELGVEVKLTKKQRAAFIKGQQRVLTIGHRTLTRRLKRHLGEGIKAGESGEQLAERGRGVFGMSQRRSKVTSMEEVSGVMNRTRTQLMKKTGIIAHRWITQNDARVRPSHKRAITNPKKWTVKIGAKFPNGLKYPQDQIGKLTGEVCGCRCMTKPILPESFGEQGPGELSAGKSRSVLTRRAERSLLSSRAS